jgi:ketosteroid isomerase-like protein
MISPPVPRRSLLLAPVLLLAGCAPAGNTGVNTGHFRGDARAVAQVLSDFSDAAGKKDGKRACSRLLARDVVHKLGPRCADVVKDQFDDADTFKLDVQSIQVNGDTATATVSSDVNGDKKPATVALRREGGSWRLAGLGR